MHLPGSTPLWLQTRVSGHQTDFEQTEYGELSFSQTVSNKFPSVNCSPLVPAQPVMVVGILIAQRQRHHPLGNQVGNRVLGAQSIAMIGKAGGKTPRDIVEPVSLPHW